MTPSLLHCLLLYACGRSANEPGGWSGPVVAAYASPCTTGTDTDGDCWPVGEDCDDGDPNVHPEAVEDCTNGVDDDCDGRVDGEDTGCPLVGAVGMDAADLTVEGSIYLVGDVDGDSSAEAVTCTCTSTDGTGSCIQNECTVTWADGVDATFPEDYDSARFGALTDDVDGDGTPDVIGGLVWPWGEPSPRGFGSIGVIRAGPITSWDTAEELFAVGGCNLGTLASVSDQDGDGRRDWAVPATDGGEHSILYLVSSAGGGTVDAESDNIARIANTYGGSSFGISDLSTADLDADGLEEIVAFEGTWAYDFTDIRGRVLVHELPVSGDLDLTDDATAVIEGASFDRIVSVGVAGDLTGDGYDDIIVGWDATEPGVVLLAGPVAGHMDTETAWDTAFSSFYNDGDASISWPVKAGTAGDVDGDGQEDLFVSGDGEATYVFFDVVEGARTYVEAGLVFEPVAPWCRPWLEAAMDGNGDGLSDLVFAAYGSRPSCSGGALFFEGR